MRYYGNLAYDESEYRDYPPSEKVDKRPEKIVDKTRMKKNRKRKSPAILAKLGKNVLILTEVLMLALSAGFMISKYVKVHEGRSEIKSLEKKLTDAEAATSQKTFDLDRSVDLSEIEKEATTRLGMQRPEKYQTIYINVPMEDVTDATSGAVEGVDNSIKNFFSDIISNLVDYFSID